MICTLCPRKCGIDREINKGRCGVGNTVKVSRAALHMWEEPCISGEEGSGTVFFSGCTLGCVYCQNRKISRGLSGKDISVERLAEIFIELQEKKANNINLVTPDHYAPQIVEAIGLARKNGLVLPIVANTGGYLSDEILDLLLPVTDIWLTDFKYLNSEYSKKYSKAEDYPEVAARALRRMFDAAGKAEYDDRDIMQKGIIVRHLMIPGCIDDSKNIVKYLHDEYGDDIVISLMNQYTPPDELKENYPEIARAVTEEEYEELIDFAVDLGVENAFVQEGGTVSESFIPEFDGTGVLG